VTQRSDPWVKALHPNVSDGSTVHPPRGTLTVAGPGAPTVTDGPTNDETILTFPDATVVTKRVDSGSATITQGYVAMQKNGKLTLATTAALALGLYHAGIVLATGAAGGQTSIITQGMIDPTTFNVGAGPACALGTDANGKVVRVTDSACVSKFKHLGVCDANGAIYVSPKNAKYVDITDFGAIGDGDAAKDVANGAAIAAAEAFAKANAPVDGKFAGIRLHVPYGVFFTDTGFDFDTTADDIAHDWPNTTLSGEGGGVVDSGSNRGASTLIYTATDASTFISARTSAYFQMRDLCVLYESASYTGTLIDFGVSLLGANSTAPIIRDCNIGCDTSAHLSAACLVFLDASLNAVISGCHISGGVKGVDLAGSTVNTTIRNTNFGLVSGGAIYNPCLATTVSSCTFENLPKAIASDLGTNYGVIGFKFDGCWCGDASDRTTAWIDPGKGEFKGAVISNNLFGGVDDGGNHALSQKDSIKLGSCAGVVISGNNLITIDFSIGEPGSYPQSVVVIGNDFGGGNTAGAPFFRGRTNASAGVVCFGNNPGGFDQGAFDQMAIGGHIVTYPTMGSAPGTSAGTNGTLAAEGNAFQGSNDTCGRITLTVAGGPIDHTAALGTVTFANKFDDGFGYKPKVVLMPENAATAGLPQLGTPVEIYVVPTWTGFAIWATADLPVGTYQWSYMVMG